MMNEENLHKARNIEGSTAIPALYNSLIAEIRRLLAEGITAGVFRADADPVAFYIAISGLGYFYCSNRHTLGTVFKVNLFDRNRIAAYKELIADMAVSYLRSR
jgi:TetR/AcrR family transcriptional regulator